MGRKTHGNYVSNLTSISGLSTWSNNVKKSIRYIYLNNNSLKSVEALKDFSNIYELWLLYNNNLGTLKGLEQHYSLTNLVVQDSGLSDITALNGCKNLSYLSIFYNKNLSSLNGLQNTNLKKIWANNCSISDISALKNLNNNGNVSPILEYLNLENNSIVDISSIENCKKINNLWLAGNSNLDSDILSKASIMQIFKNCKGSYSIDSKYGLLFIDDEKINLENYNLTDDQLALLQGKTNIKALCLTNNSQLSNSKLEQVLSTLTNLVVLKLNGVTNLSSCNFISSLPKLMYLDIRDTNLTNLAKLEECENNNTLSLVALLLNNPNTTLSNIQKAISMISFRSMDGDALPLQYIFEKERNRGILIFHSNLMKKLSGLNQITRLYSYYGSGVSDMDRILANLDCIDLSKCTRLERISVRRFIYSYSYFFFS